MAMPYVLVLYYSSGGTTSELAKLIARGVEEQGIEAIIRTVPKVSTNVGDSQPSIPDSGDCYVTQQELEDCSALAVGSPTRFGNMAAPLKHFIDQTSDTWIGGKLSGKPVSFFTSSSSLHGGQESTLLTMMIPFLHHGMLIMGLPYSETELLRTEGGGTPYGISHWNGHSNQRAICKTEKTLAIAQGRRLALFASKLRTS
jgi:NAD(P)H dehydrogenase (quinone)